MFLFPAKLWTDLRLAAYAQMFPVCFICVKECVNCSHTHVFLNVLYVGAVNWVCLKSVLLLKKKKKKPLVVCQYFITHGQAPSLVRAGQMT